MRRLVVVLGDQLNRDSAAFDGFDPAQDAVWMAEVPAEGARVWSHKARIALFLSAMRHFRDALRAQGVRVHYLELTEYSSPTLAAALHEAILREKPQVLRWVRAGEWGVEQSLREVAQGFALPVEQPEDRHFLCSDADFSRWARGWRYYRMEHFYRWLRQREGVLMQDGEPVGGRWNFDAENRQSFDARGPGLLPAPASFAPDPLTRAVLQLVATRFAGHPGGLADFDWPVTRAQALEALQDFVTHRLPCFGPHQDAMWAGEPWLHHSRLSAALNLKLLNPREVIDAAGVAHDEGRAPLSSVEAFIRQILGWREYVRGLYWRRMPGWLEDNVLSAQQSLPAFYWSGDTDMKCLREVIGQTLRYGYAHHIQRLMVTGLFALLLGVRPRAVHEWYLAVYVDAVEWVELPNTLGMSQYADGGVLASKPYIASGQYIRRMSNYCNGCRYAPQQATGETACPFTTLYWDFLLRHGERFGGHPRMALQVRNSRRLDTAQQSEIRARAAALRAALADSSAAPGSAFR